MRERLVRSDAVECIIGLGPNLFYNSPMEACIMICRMNKSSDRRGKVLFINAVNEVERKNAQSYLEDRHIERIAAAYEKYSDEAGFAKLAGIEDIERITSLSAFRSTLNRKQRKTKQTAVRCRSTMTAGEQLLKP